jgi:hypothetical protein
VADDKIQNLDISQLRLDPKNPRLPESLERDQDSMLRYIARTSSIAELMTAIGQHGYFAGEPLIVVPGEKKKYVVVEGNRRLTALILLRDPDQLGKVRSIQTAAADAEKKPDNVPCIIFESRDEVVNYLGYRHITGIKQWEPLAKARYVAQYFDTQTSKKDNPESRYRAVARSIGSQYPYIKRQLDGMAIYRAIEREAFFDIDGLDEENIAFSLLTTCLGYESILNFVSDVSDPYLHPAKLKKPRIKELTQWLFEKDEDGETRLGESRNIKRLAVIVESAAALKELRAGADLEAAYSKTRGLADDFTEVLVNTERDIGKAVSMVALVDLDDSHRRRILNISKQAKALEKFDQE